MSSASPKAAKPAGDHKILFQNWFKSAGPRTYAAQLKMAKNGNHFLVLTEGKRDETSGDVRKTSLFIFSEDFPAFFKMLHEAAVFVREHPVSDEVKKRQERHWAKVAAEAGRSPGADQRGSAPPKPQDHIPSAANKTPRPAPARQAPAREGHSLVGAGT